MTRRRKKKVNIKKKRYHNFIAFYLVIVVFTFANYTFSRYTATSEAIATIKTARFNIAVNEHILGKEEKFNLLLVSNNSNTYNNKLAPNSTGYFEIVINPSGTHVSLEYEVIFNISEIVNAGKTIVLTKYSLDNGETFTKMPNDSKIEGEILLNGAAFTSNDAVTLRVYWQWQQDLTNPVFNNETIQVTSIVKQKISSESEV